MSERENETIRPTKSSGEVIDLLAALQRSVDAAKAQWPPAPTPAHPSEGADRG